MNAGLNDCTLVLIPGMQCTEDTFADVSSVLDLRHPGISVVITPIRAGSLDAAVADLLSHGDDIVAVGHSLGGTVAMAAARRFPDRVRGLATLCANPLGPRRDQQAGWTDQIDRVARGEFEACIDELLPVLCAPNQSRSLQHRTRAMMTATGPDGLVAQLRIQQQRVDERPGLAAFPGSVLALGAEHDRLVSSDASRAIGATAPRGHSIIVPDAGHMLPLERPESVADLLSAWLTDDLAHSAGHPEKEKGSVYP